MSIVEVEDIVRKRYGESAQTHVAELCCPTDYDPKFLKAIPDEVLERDYGCGDPSRHLREGEIVLDLGSGTGKICFIAAQVVGSRGRVIGVDMTAEMLDIARRNAPLVAERLGYANVEFRRGRIQDLGLDLDRFEEELKAQPVSDLKGLLAAESRAEDLRQTEPLVATESVDVVVSNCVLNLVENSDKQRLIEEIFRVLVIGGRAVISDILSDEPVPEELQNEADLWSGCISGAWTEGGFLEAFEAAGFYGVRILERQAEPWRTVQGIEFRSVTVEAFKGKQGPCYERRQAVIYKGPFKEVVDDDGHRIKRGQRYAVCDKTYKLYQRAPYAQFFEAIAPLEEVPLDQARLFDCTQDATRDPHETKGLEYDRTTEAQACCEPGDCC
ncbi:MAG: methyltransferase domain-containing protein [Thermoanaerobaculia bacterium]